jgi:hypothetical protein
MIMRAEFYPPSAGRVRALLIRYSDPRQLSGRARPIGVRCGRRYTNPPVSRSVDSIGQAAAARRNVSRAGRGGGLGEQVTPAGLGVPERRGGGHEGVDVRQESVGGRLVEVVPGARDLHEVSVL